MIKKAIAQPALRGYASTFNIKIDDVSIVVNAEPGVADSGLLELDLTELFVLIGQVAQSAGTAWTVLIDEVQYLSSEELAAIIVAIHRVNQRGLGTALTANSRLSARSLF